MKLICISHWRFPSEKTFAPYIMCMLEAVAREGVEVELLCPRRRDPALQNVDPFEYHGIDRTFTIKKLPVIDLMHVLPGTAGFLLMLASFSIVAACYVAMSSARRNAVLYFFDLRDAWATLLFSRRAFCEVHMYYRSSIDIVNRWGFKRVRGLMANTTPILENIRTTYGVESNRLIHTPSAVNIKRYALDTSKEDARAALGLPREGKLIFYAGHLFPVKGVDVLFDAHRFLEPGEVIYFIGGTDTDIAHFRHKWQEAGRPDSIVIAGRKRNQDIPLWLRAADILSLPNTAKDTASSLESSPTKLIEYMASGRPIVASDVPGIRDVLKDGMGYFVEPDNAKAIASAIHEVFASPQEAAARVSRARAAAENLSWDARARKVLAFIRSFPQ